jgi:mono/diheme cytochrome c family protein
MRTSVFAVSLIVCAVVSGCESKPADLREWRASDHSNAGSSSEDPGGAAAPTDPLTNARALWSSQCAACHGREGRGDGPQSAIRPPDMSTAEFQSSGSDAQFAASITNGKNGRMPAFASLRPEAVQLLVRLVRGFAAR